MVPLEPGETMYRNKHWENFIDLDWQLCGYIRYPLFRNQLTSPSPDTEQVALIRFLCLCEYHELKDAESFLEKLKKIKALEGERLFFVMKTSKYHYSRKSK